MEGVEELRLHHLIMVLDAAGLLLYLLDVLFLLLLLEFLLQLHGGADFLGVRAAFAAWFDLEALGWALRRCPRL